MQSLVSGSHHAPTDIRSTRLCVVISNHLTPELIQTIQPLLWTMMPSQPLKGNLITKAVLSLALHLPVDDGTYVFKSRTPSGRTHRFQSRHDDVKHLRVHQTPSPLVTATPSSSIIISKPYPITFDFLHAGKK